ncbi:serine/arginine-rich splicing factor 11-like isoform X1 [Xiphophorus maculatus]|uniref:Serine and arginine rich splicing factor 11 n=1 Tax=Xiphophorus maculatus TaxID=8083 RepID=M4AXN7_XIPMA|nr:serine/arginine-rich splicing factor 11-like isoform X1 [Xiphophorus maculatus]XP_032422451.1 LOW QUALITY PROTEIN: serine/arginine-rich splicing factor 11-like [Xiphophorus hellerii]XP_054888878.1 serine/arginine-rich splicing factor 11-like isoform X1 [Poeciliopsis prolifica]
MSYTTRVVQVTNVSPSTTSEQMRTLFGFLGTIEELKLFPPDDSPMPVTSRVCFVKFQEPESVGVSQHLTNTVFVDRALIVVPFAEGSIPDEAKALSLLAPANAVAGILPGGGLLPTPNPLPNPALGANPFGPPTIDPMAAFGFAGPNMNPQAADQLLKMMTDPKLNPLAAGLNLSASLKADASNKEIEEAMKRVREAQSLISAAIEPGHKESKKKHSRSRSRSRRRRTRSRSRHSRRRTRSRSRRRSSSRSRRRSKSPRRRRTHSRDRGRRTRSRSRDRKKEDVSRRRSKTPPKSYSTARRSRSASRRRRRSRTASRSPKKSPKRRVSPSPSPRRHKKEKKRDKDRERERRSDKERVREERERSTSKKKKSKDKERERERKSDGDKGDIKITRDYDEEEQGYDSEKEREERKDSDDSAMSPQSVEGNGSTRLVKQAKVNGADDRHEEDMDVSD